jgi:hypothetical protein
MDEQQRALLDDLLATIIALDAANYAVVHAFEDVINARFAPLNKLDTTVEFLNHLGHVDAAQRELKTLVAKAMGTEVQS